MLQLFLLLFIIMFCNDMSYSLQSVKNMEPLSYSSYLKPVDWYLNSPRQNNSYQEYNTLYLF